MHSFTNNESDLNKAIDLINRSMTSTYTHVRNNLKKIGLSTSYAGFKYLADLIVHVLCNNTYSCYSTDIFKYVADMHSTNYSCVERDIRHMLVTTWQKNSGFKQIIQLECETPPSAKAILNKLIQYLKTTV